MTCHQVLLAKPFTDHRLHRHDHPQLLVPDAPHVVPRHVFVEVALHVFRRHVVVGVSVASLHHAPDALHAVHVHVPVYVLASAAVDRLVVR